MNSSAQTGPEDRFAPLTVHRLDAVLRAGLPQSACSEAARNALLEVAAWLDVHVSRPNQQLGRPGDVCPWTRRATQLGALLLCVCDSLTAHDADATILTLKRGFLALQAEAPSQFRAIVTVFPQRGPHVEDFIVGTHARLKPQFLARQLMLGEFYPSCDKPGLRNPDFRPLRSPWPLLVIRPMVEADIEFLLDEDRFIDAYLNAFGERGAERLSLVLREKTCAVPQARLDMLMHQRGVRRAPQQRQGDRLR